MDDVGLFECMDGDPASMHDGTIMLSRLRLRELPGFRSKEDFIEMDRELVRGLGIAGSADRSGAQFDVDRPSRCLRNGTDWD